MNSNKTRKWIDAGIALSSDSNVNVLCPECEKTKLSVKDIIDENHSIIVERMIYCEICGAKNYIRLNRKINVAQED